MFFIQILVNHGDPFYKGISDGIICSENQNIQHRLHHSAIGVCILVGLLLSSMALVIQFLSFVFSNDLQKNVFSYDGKNHILNNAVRILR